MSTKGPWEERVGMLLKPPYFTYAHKCPDIGPHGGQTKIDWLACGLPANRLDTGQFWGIEVKWIQTVGTLFHVNQEVTPGQQARLEEIAENAGFAFVAVGHGKKANEHKKYTTGLYVVAWNTLRHYEHVDLQEVHNLFLPWVGEKTFATEENRKKLWLWQQR